MVLMDRQQVEAFMRIALKQARLACERGEVPVGAILVFGDRILARAHNSPIKMQDPTAHAEILAIRKAARKLDNYRIGDAILFTTLEPCIMCAGAILHARIGRVVYGTEDPKNGAVVSRYKVFDDKRFNHTVQIEGGILKDDCAEILRRFFQEKRIISPSVSLDS
jgi:tRNA(adenine34) deaminase